jgi:hypothetical protein
LQFKLSIQYAAFFNHGLFALSLLIISTIGEGGIFIRPLQNTPQPNEMKSFLVRLSE